MPRTLRLLLLAAGLGACSPEESAQMPFDTTNGVNVIMTHVMDPATDIVWGATGYVITAEGETDLSPTTDEGWQAVAAAAAVVAESGNLLMMPGRAIEEKDWMDYSQAIVATGILAMEAAEAKDKEKLFEVGGQLYRICVACHQRYVTPE